MVGVANTTDRNANMTPPARGAPVVDASVGRADELHALFRDELKPWVDAHYSTHPLDVPI